jgi:hypothetical protein
MGNENPLGKKIIGNAGRDAVHSHILPVEAGENLKRAEWVKVVKGIATKSPSYSADGYIDPNLEYGANKGDRVWVILKPNTVTGMRHAWSHPKFEDEPDGRPEREMPDSEKWMRDFAEEAGLSYQACLDAAEEWLNYEEYYIQYGTESARYAMSTYGAENFWKHYEEITGKKVPGEKKEAFFSCSC